MLGGRGRAKQREDGPRVPLRRPHARTGGAGDGAAISVPLPDDNGEPAPLRRPESSSELAPLRRPGSTSEPAPLRRPGSVTEPAPLRRPGSATTTPTTPTFPASSVPGVPQRRPSQEAPVWPAVPVPGLPPAPPASQSSLNPLSAPFVPRAVLAHVEPHPEEPEPPQNEPVTQALIRDIPDPSDPYQTMIYNNISEALHNMTCFPASFSRLGCTFVDNLNGWLPSSGVQLSTVLDWLFSQVAWVPSFRYVCAKLCHLLCTRCRVTEKGKTFRDLLLSRCQQLYSGADALLAEDVHGFCELLILFCELYLHVLLGGGEEPIGVLGVAALGLCGQLMDDVTPERVSAVCRALKLAGSTLEGQHPQKLEMLMERVRTAALDMRLPRDSCHALLELATLRASRWGGQADARRPQVASEPSDGAHPLQSDPTCPLTGEELHFMEQQTAGVDDDDDDEEIADAYEAFLEELDSQYQ